MHKAIVGLGVGHLLHDIFMFPISGCRLYPIKCPEIYGKKSHYWISQRECKVTVVWLHFLFISYSISPDDCEIRNIYIMVDTADFI